MIASLRGTVIDMGAGYVVVECGGVGHLVQVTAKTAAGLTRGEEGFLRTALVVREDAMTLYGFGAEAEREMFDVLQTVSGLGPKLAMAVLQVLDPAEIAVAVGAGDGKKLQLASGVGKRMADRMVLELKGKVAEFEAPAAAPEAPQRPGSGGADAAQVVSALVGLGFREQEADSAVAAVLADDASLDTSAALRATLKALGR